MAGQAAALVGPQHDFDTGGCVEDDDWQLRPRRVRGLAPSGPRPAVAAGAGSGDARPPPMFENRGARSRRWDQAGSRRPRAGDRDQEQPHVEDSGPFRRTIPTEDIRHLRRRWAYPLRGSGGNPPRPTTPSHSTGRTLGFVERGLACTPTATPTSCRPDGSGPIQLSRGRLVSCTDGRRRTHVDAAPKAGGQGVAGSNPVIPTGESACQRPAAVSHSSVEGRLTPTSTRTGGATSGERSPARPRRGVAAVA